MENDIARAVADVRDWKLAIDPINAVLRDRDMHIRLAVDEGRGIVSALYYSSKLDKDVSIRTDIQYGYDSPGELAAHLLDLDMEAREFESMIIQ